MKRVKRFGVYQTSKVVAINLFVVSLIFMIPFGLISNFLIGSKFPGFPFTFGLSVFLLPVVYGVMTFIMTAISCLIYNFIAEWTGGIAIELEVVDEPVDESDDESNEQTE